MELTKEHLAMYMLGFNEGLCPMKLNTHQKINVRESVRKEQQALVDQYNANLPSYLKYK